MSKKVFIGIIIVVMFVGVTILLSNKLKNKNIDNLVEEYCTTDHSLGVVGDALTEWNCQLCGKSAIIRWKKLYEYKLELLYHGIATTKGLMIALDNNIYVNTNLNPNRNKM